MDWNNLDSKPQKVKARKSSSPEWSQDRESLNRYFFVLFSVLLIALFAYLGDSLADTAWKFMGGTRPAKPLESAISWFTASVLAVNIFFGYNKPRTVSVLVLLSAMMIAPYLIIADFSDF